MARYLVPRPASPFTPGPPDPARLISGMATAVDNGPYRWTLGELSLCAEAARIRPPAALRLGHQDLSITSSGVEQANVGEILDLAAVPERDSVPAGLVMIGMLHPSPARWLLPAMENRREWMALSIGGEHMPQDPGYRLLELKEVSLVNVGRQLDPCGLVVATGPRALSAWSLLTGREVVL